MNYNWNTEKDELLRKERGVCFSDVVEAVNYGRGLADIQHKGDKYKHQRILVVEIQEYAYYVPYVIEEDGTKFLKTIYPSRNATKQYLK